jgi:hypothetical protein
MKKSTVVLFQIIGVCLVVITWMTTHNAAWGLILSSVCGLFIYITKNKWQNQKK